MLSGVRTADSGRLGGSGIGAWVQHGRRVSTRKRCWHCGRTADKGKDLCVRCTEKGKLGPYEQRPDTLVCVNGKWMNRKNALRAMGGRP